MLGRKGKIRTDIANNQDIPLQAANLALQSGANEPAEEDLPTKPRI